MQVSVQFFSFSMNLSVIFILSTQVSELGRPFTGGSWCGTASGVQQYFSETSTVTASVKVKIHMELRVFTTYMSFIDQIFSSFSSISSYLHIRCFTLHQFNKKYPSSLEYDINFLVNQKQSFDMARRQSYMTWDSLHPALIVHVNLKNAIVTNVACNLLIIQECIPGM